MGVVLSATFMVFFCAFCSIAWGLLERSMFNALMIREIESYVEEYGLSDYSFIDAAMWRNQDD